MKIFSVEIAGYEITLLQNAKQEFIVQYGHQQYKTKCYETAAKELGECITHALLCDGKIEQD